MRLEALTIIRGTLKRSFRDKNEELVSIELANLAVEVEQPNCSVLNAHRVPSADAAVGISLCQEFVCKVL